MKKILIALLIYIPSIQANELNLSDISTYFEVSSFSYSESIAISSGDLLTDNWNSKLYYGDIAFSTNYIELGFIWNQWSFGVLRRHDYFYKFTPDTAFLKHSTANNIDLIPGQQLDISLTTNVLVANGLSMAFAHTINKTNFAIKASYLQGKNLTSGHFFGNATVVSKDYYDINFKVDSFYSKDNLFGREITAPDGHGFAIDISINWVMQQWDFNLEVKDLLARMYWEETPRTIASGNTRTKSFDKYGFVIFNPVVSGLETNQDYTQKLPRKVHFAMAYNLADNLSDNSLLFEVHDFEIKRFYSIGAGWNKNKNEQISIFYNITAQAIKFDYQNKWLVFSITSDKIKLKKARLFAFKFGVVVGF